MSRDTTAHVRGGQAVPAHKHACVCEHATELPHLHLDSSTRSSSRDQQTSLPFRRRHTHNAAPLPLVCGGKPMAHCHLSQAPSNDVLSLYTFSWMYFFFFSMKCLWY